MALLKAARPPSQRGIYIVAVIITIALGLASRAFAERLPAFVAGHAGDALWAMMVYFGFRLLFVRRTLLFAMVLSVMFSFSIELSQLYQADWINAVRGTVLGALVLGKGFLVIDLVRYLLGIILAVVLDKIVIKKRLGQK
ncbi:DUF2809 domain-containing protein [Bacillus marasmi]|uniref:ribosomal maturation YjgA family protein n=1 Tax=Bacillus marasmi TaxID=1926279 RepID=UPI00164E81FB|nr:DUF2809 domain-containing protein [Bacillus marasmi]